MYLNSTLVLVNQYQSWAYIPLESQYADGMEYLDENMEVVEKMMEVVPGILENWSLFVNESKTAYTCVYLAETKERDEHNKLLRGNEQWRETVVLGSKYVL